MTWLADLCWPAAAERAGQALLAVPLGATEQHGPHLPLSTDTEIARACAAGLAGLRGDVLVAPALEYGSSGEHQEFPGTVSIGQRALELVLVELVRSARTAFPRVVLVNGHGGNTGPLGRATRRLGAEGHDVLAWSASWHGDAHAGLEETSLLLQLRPGAVGAPVAGTLAPLAELAADLQAGRFRQVAPSGVLGDARGATAERGYELLRLLVADLAAAVGARWPADG